MPVVKTPTLSIASQEPGINWFYLSRFNPFETTAKIIQYVACKSKCSQNQIICHKLVSNKRNNNLPLTYISFKLHVPKSVESLVTSHDFWPKGVFITPFSAEKPNRNLNKPNLQFQQQIPRTPAFNYPSPLLQQLHSPAIVGQPRNFYYDPIAHSNYPRSNTTSLHPPLNQAHYE